MSRYRVQKQAFSNHTISQKSSPSIQTRPWTNPYQQQNDQVIGKPAYIANPPTTEEWKKNNILQRVIETRQAELQQQAIQAKLTVGEPGDKYEQEADAMASQVMSMPDTAVQKESEEQVQTKPLAQRVTPVIRLTAARNGRIQVQSNLESRLNSSKGGGNPLPNQVRSFMEPRFGADFSQVRVHTDNTAVQMSRDLGAQAFTHGSDIYYGEGKAPGQNELTAHELTHVVQQGGAKTLNQEVQTKPKPKTTNFNKEVRLFPDSQTLAAKQLPEINEDLTNKESTPLHQKIENYNPETPVQTKQLDTENLLQRQPLNISSANPQIQRWSLGSFLEGTTQWLVERALGRQVIEMLGKAGDVIGKIIDNPASFLSNLVTAIRNGFTKFQDNIGTHLTNGLMGWLFGALSGSGLVLPSTFDAKGLLSVALQVLGLTYNNFRARLARRLGDENVNRLEQSYDFLQKISSGGLTEASEDICQEVGDIQETILGGIKDWLINAVIKAAVTKLITMFNPVGGLIEAAKAIYNTVMFFIERMQQIAALVDSIFSSIGKIVAGDTDSASNYIEQAMARTIPVVISFFARLLGLGGISDRIKAVIQRIQAPINRALDKLEQKIADKARTLLNGNQGQNQAPQQSAATPVTAPAPQSQPPSSATPQAPASASVPTTTAPAPQSPSSPATTPARTQAPLSQSTPNSTTTPAPQSPSSPATTPVGSQTSPSQPTPNRTTAPGQQNPSSPATQTANQTPAQQQNQPAQQNTFDETANHRTLARQAVSELEQTRGENKDYETLRREKETQARQIEQNYTRRLRAGIKLTVRFEDAARDKQDGKLDFKVIIAPNDTEDKGSIPVPKNNNRYKAIKRSDEAIEGDFKDFVWDGYPSDPVTPHPVNAKYEHKNGTTVPKPQGKYVLISRERDSRSVSPSTEKWRNEVRKNINAIKNALGIDEISAEKELAKQYNMCWKDLNLDGWQAHHIHPHNWGGSNDDSWNWQYLKENSNGVAGEVPPKQHKKFSNWWRVRKEDIKKEVQ
ncbi:MAG TPA: DUF4157 domain-containing protein [Nostocaceae cyanobacterium]|nr:DUF4157 domain-containing protein [Nostocaceae cyanobacterium]